MHIYFYSMPPQWIFLWVFTCHKIIHMGLIIYNATKQTNKYLFSFLMQMKMIMQMLRSKYAKRETD
jgi:hypothetical protein